MKRWQKWLLAVVLLVPAASGFGAWWHRGSERAQCSLQLFNYNTAIHSCGIDGDCTEAWKSPEATQKMVLKHFGQQLPQCPAGGKVSIAYERPAPHRWLPCAVCSQEHSHDHEDPHRTP